MKKLILVLAAVFSFWILQAQTPEPPYNPFVRTASVTPAPLPPLAFNGTGVASFSVGNEGTMDLVWDAGIPNNDMLLVLTLSRGVPNVPTLDATTALTAIGGTFAAKFTWSYDVPTNTFTGRQNQTIAANDSGMVTIQYKVTEDSHQSTPQNGFNVNLTPPPYTNGQTTDDDAISFYTYTEFSDFGDAPASYPVANHMIDYDNFLGALFDGELGNQPSLDATGDDVSDTDDEDGVVIPALVQGETATMTITVTGLGYLNGWIDWNGDADFDDAGEQIILNNALIEGVYPIPVTVPYTAISTQPTFARFRLGPSGTGPSGVASFGEVEDYMVTITCTPPETPLADLTQPGCDTATGSIALTAPLGQVFEYSMDGGATWTSVASFTDLAPGTHTITVRDVSRDLACWSEAAFVIDPQPETPVAPVLTIVPTDCFTATGSIEVTSPLEDGFTYSVNGDIYAISPLFEGLLPGTYTVTVRSADGCVSTETLATIDPQPETPVAPVLTIVQPDCFTATGSIEVTSPLDEGYTYSIDGETYTNTTMFEGLLPGTYTVTVMSADGCVSTETLATIDPQPETPVAPVLTTVQPDCATATGTIEVTSPVEEGFTYSVNGDIYAISPLFEGLLPGTYTVTVMSADGCVSSETIETIDPQPETPEMPEVEVIQPDCLVSTGSIDVLSPHGEGLTFSIDGESYQEFELFDDLLPGAYTVTVMNAYGCVSEAATVTIEFGGITPLVDAGPDMALGCSITEVTLEGSSETEGVSFMWEGPGIVSGGDTPTPLVNAAGTYTLTVTHTESGCAASDVTEVLPGGEPPVLVLKDGYCVYLTQDGKWTLNAYDIAQITAGSSVGEGGSGALTFTFSRRTFECRDVYPPYTAVEVTATDAGGCVTTGTFNLMVLDTIAPVAKCRNITVQLDAFGQVLVVPGFVNDGGDRENVPGWAKYYKDLEGGSFDNCGIAEMYLTKSIFTREDVGDNQVVLTVIDPSGNIAECEATVTVVDPYAEEAGLPGEGEDENEGEEGQDPGTVVPNIAPTLADVTDIEIMEKAMQLDVQLTGISAGEATGQQVKITAVADNPSLITGIAVVYENGTTGQLVVTVAPGMSGESWITVTVKDDGGTANGGVDMIEKRFKVTVTATDEEVTIGITDPDGDAVVTSTIDLTAAMGFKLYPNPTRGKVNIEMNGTGIRDTQVSVYTINGIEVFRKVYRAGEQISVDLSPYVSGVYMVRTEVEGASFLRKVILDKH